MAEDKKLLSGNMSMLLLQLLSERSSNVSIIS